MTTTDPHPRRRTDTVTPPPRKGPARSAGGRVDPATDAAGTTRHEAIVDALLSASRAMVALAARSLAGVDAEVTLPQYRTLVVLAARGPQRAVDVAAELGVNPSTGTRMCDRLVRKGLVRRTRPSTDRRVVRLTLTKAGRDLVQQVTDRRREELVRIVSATSARWSASAVAALRAFAAETGEPPDGDWWLGWATSDDADD
jgi:DNA-binding MarR family transcriptional regulator